MAEAAEGELILFMDLEDSAHHGGPGEDGAGLSGTALSLAESKQAGSVRVQPDFFLHLFYSVWAPSLSVWAPSLSEVVPPTYRNESFSCHKFFLGIPS